MDQDPTPPLHYLNDQHPRVKFTSDTEIKSKIPFLDVLVSRENNQLQTSVYRKPTHTEQYINFNPNHPLQVKKGFVSTLTKRTINISSSPQARKDELDHIKNVFKDLNNYPTDLTDRTFHQTTQRSTQTCERPLSHYNYPPLYW